MNLFVRWANGKFFSIIWLLTASNEVNHSCCDWKGPAQLGNFLVQTRIFDGLLQQGGICFSDDSNGQESQGPQNQDNNFDHADDKPGSQQLPVLILGSKDKLQKNNYIGKVTLNWTLCSLIQIQAV